MVLQFDPMDLQAAFQASHLRASRARFLPRRRPCRDARSREGVIGRPADLGGNIPGFQSHSCF